MTSVNFYLSIEFFTTSFYPNSHTHVPNRKSHPLKNKITTTTTINKKK